ncbi:MAG: hypothetical protein AAFX79_02445 [Planctomycetota bacterium]
MRSDAPTITDDRGRDRPLRPPRLVLPWHGRAFLAMPGRWVFLAMLLLAAGLAWATVRTGWSGLRIVRGGPMPGESLDIVLAVGGAMLVLLLTGVGLPAMYLWIASARTRSWRARLRLLAGRCAACEYDMSGLLPEDDERCVCPECAAAWRCDLLSAGAHNYGAITRSLNRSAARRHGR